MVCISAVALRLIVACALVAVVLGSGSWDDVGGVLTNAIKNNTFPGCVAIVVSAKGTLYAKAFGSLTYDQTSPQVATPAVFPAKTRPHALAQVALDTKFDIASLSKVTACTTAAMQAPRPRTTSSMSLSQTSPAFLVVPARRTGPRHAAG